MVRSLLSKSYSAVFLWSSDESESRNFWAATTIADAIGTPVHVCGSRANIQPGERVMVVGAAGGVGIHMLQVAKLHGAELIAVDLDDAKLERTREYGADHLVNLEGLGADGNLHRVQEAGLPV